MKIYLSLFAIFIVVVAGVSGNDIPPVGGNPPIPGSEIVIQNYIYTNAGEIGYSIQLSDGIGRITNMPIATEVANNNFISVAVEGCSIEGALSIDGSLWAASAGGDYASVGADIDGPAASVSDYNLYGYVTPDLAWAGQYIGSATGSRIDLAAIGDEPPKEQGPFLTTNTYWAGSYLFTRPSNIPVYTVNNWYHDAMSGPNWAMANIYSGTATVFSPNPADSLDAYTGSKDTCVPGLPPGKVLETEIGAQAYVTQNNFINIRGLSMGYVDPHLLYSNVDTTIRNTNVFDYWYINWDTGVNDKNTIFW